ncbi:MAG: DUF4043 family protein [Aquabacterium sp.]|uniref:phage capsid family protein n=1 Tax=Aquabacterium sp. TaxID=1872578 RepID=UPI003BB1633A
MTTQVTDKSAFALKQQSVALTAAAIKAPTDLSRLCGAAPKQGEAEQIVKQQSNPGLPGIIVKDLSAAKSGTMVTIEAYDVLGGEPIMGDEMREGRGENVDIASMEAKIDLASKVINAVPGTMIDQRTKINLRGMAMAQLMGYFPRLMWNRALVHIAGARGAQRGKSWHIPLQSAQNFSKVMINPVLAPTYNRHLVIDGANVVQGGQQLANIDSTDGWKLGHIDAIAEYLDSLEFKLQPLRVPGDPAASDSPIRGVLFLDPQAYAQLVTEATAGNNIRAWQSAAIERANQMGQRHPLFRGDILMWNKILIRSMEHSICFNPGDTVKHISSANRYTATETDVQVNGGLGNGFRVTRSVLMGAQAFASLLGKNSSSGFTAAFKERVYDYGSKHEAMGEWMGAEAKLRFSFKNADGILEPTDHGILVIDGAVKAVGQ